VFTYFVKSEDIGDTRLCIYRHFSFPVGYRKMRSLELKDSEPESLFYFCLFFTLHSRIVHFNTPQRNEGKTLRFLTRLGLY